MMKQLVAGVALALAVMMPALVGTPAWAQQGQPLTPEQQKAHDEAKATARKATQANGLLDGMVGGKGKALLPDALTNEIAGSGNPSPENEAKLVACYARVMDGKPVVPEELSTLCEPMMNAVGFNQNHAQNIHELMSTMCAEVLQARRAPGTRLEQHCGNLLAVRAMADKAVAGHEAALAGAQLHVNVTDKERPTITPDDIRNSYSACTTGTEQVAPAGYEEKVCESTRVAQTNNGCDKKLVPEVTWVCPAGAVSGPTRVEPGTLDKPGRYTCEVQVGADVVTQDATFKVTDQWGGNCASFESGTPDAWRTGLGFGLPPMEAFNPAPNTARCRITQSACIDPGLTPRLVNDVPLTRSCWAYQERFDCLSTQVAESCEADSQCSPVSDTCLEWDNFSSPPSCVRHETRLSCQTSPPVTREVTTCENQTYCPGGACWDTGYKNNTEMGQAMSSFAVAQQGARYFNANDFQLFRGFPAACGHRLGGILNCCKKNAFGDILFDVLHAPDMFRPPSFAFGDGDQNGLPLFNDQVYDFLYLKDSTGLLAASMRALTTLTGEAVDIWADIKEQDFKGALLKGTITTPLKVVGAIYNQYIDRVIEFTTLFGLVEGCTEDDALTLSKQKLHLCVGVGSHCTKKMPITGWCIGDREYRSCCFNSVLAKLINDQGRAQLMQRQIQGTLSPPNLAASLFGTDARSQSERFGTGEAPNCIGFSIEQFKAIDFSKIDFGPFLATVAPKLPDKNAAIARVAAMVSACGGGSSQCDGDTPQSQLADAGIGVAEGRDGGQIAKQLVSLKPLVKMAFGLPERSWTPKMAINSEDWRFLSSYRFKEGEPAVTARVMSLSDIEGYPGCKRLRVETTRARVDEVIYDKRVPVRDKNGTVVDWRAAGPGEGRIEVPDSGEIAVLPGSVVSLDAHTMQSDISYCLDGSIPGLKK